MRVANLEGRLVVVSGDAGHEAAYDVEKNSGGRFAADPQAVYEDWDAFTSVGGDRPVARRRDAAARGPRAARARPAAGVRHRAELPRPRRRVRLRRTHRRTSGVHQVPQLHHRPAR